MSSNGYDFFEEDEHHYDSSSDIQIRVDKAVEKREKYVRRSYRYASIGVCVVMAVLFLCVSAFLYTRKVDDITSQYEQKLDNLSNEYAEKVSEKIDYQYTINNGRIDIATNVAFNTLSAIVEIYCYKSSFGSSANNYSATATGFIINDEGYLITNAHVVTYELTTNTWSGTKKVYTYSKFLCNFRNSKLSYELELITYDRDKDLALMKFKKQPDKFSYLTFMDSDNIRLGEYTVVIGNADGLGISVTTGIVSNTAKIYNDVELLQTNAAVNPGNSGGPIFNSNSFCMGVISSKIANTETEGLAFAITSKEIKSFIEKYNEVHLKKIEYTFYIPLALEN